jgi:hypothetical protein
MLLYSVRSECAAVCLFAAGVFVTPAWALDRIVPDEFPTIQAAITASNTGDVVVVKPGTYTENLTLKSGIEVRGQETARTMVRATSGTVMQLTGLSDVTVRNLTFNGGETGIDIRTNSGNIEILNNVFVLGNTATAVRVDILSAAEIRHNTFHDNDVAVERTATTTVIRNNIFSSNDTAVSGTIATNISFNCFATGDATIGSDATSGNVSFADVTAGDFHLRSGSVCIDAGNAADSNDVFDDSTADAGAYGGEFADTRSFPVGRPNAAVVESAVNTGLFDATLTWTRNLSYLTSGYEIHYGSGRSGEYNGDDAQDDGGNPTPSPIVVGADKSSHTLRNLLSSPAAPDAPVLQPLSPSNRSLDLRWSAVEGATGYRIEYGIAAVDENSRDVGNVTASEIGGLENGVTYRVRVSALRQTSYFFALKVLGTPDNDESKSVFSPERSISVGPAQVGAPSNERTGTPEVVEPYPALPDQGGCFIATAAYGDVSHPWVRLLRDFRDQRLLSNPPGRVFTRWYYRHSPAAAAFIARHDGLRTFARWALLPVVGMAWLALHAPALLCALAALCALTVITLRRSIKSSAGSINLRAGTS